jgi:thioredoxin 1
MRTARLIFLVLAVLLPGQVLPSWAQGPPPGGRPTILAFERKGCHICHQVEMILKEVQERYPGQFEVRRLFIDEEEPTFRRYHVVIVPTQVFVDPAGQEVFRHEGVLPKDELIKKLRELKFIRD